MRVYVTVTYRCYCLDYEVQRYKIDFEVVLIDVDIFAAVNVVLYSKFEPVALIKLTKHNKEASSYVAHYQH